MQGVWACILMAVAVFWLLNGATTLGGGLALIVAAYGYAISALYRRRRWAWWCCIVPPTAALAAFGPMVLYNLWRAAQNDPRFSDSPGTFIVVLIDAAVLVIPSVLMLLRLLLSRRELSPNNRWRGP
jgi:hypothetical protein